MIVFHCFTIMIVRAAKFIARKNYMIAGSDDMQLRVFNYNTHEKIHSWDAHSDYVRCVAVHPTQPYVLSGSDDMTIRLWDWEKNWKLVQVRGLDPDLLFLACVRTSLADAN
jgi:coatomer subunit beta'